MKRKYSVKLQDSPRLTLLIKGFTQDVKHKAAIFDDVLIKQFMVAKMDSAYWQVTQAITIMAFFGGLRQQECLDLVLEKVQRGEEGYFVTHTRVKQRRSDKLETKFLVPAAGGYADQLGVYLNKVNMQLSKYKGRVWFTGTQSQMLKNQAMGKNMLAKLPHELATRFSLPDPSIYTFHSFRRTSATSAADGGSSTAQMTDFFGWKNPTMCHEYVSSSKPAITSMAKKLAGRVEPGGKVELAQETVQKVSQGFILDDPEIEVELEVELEVEVAQDVDNKEEYDQFIFKMEEDPDMYAAAGLPIPVCTPIDFEKTISNVMNSVRHMNESNVNIKVIIVTGNNTTMNF
jgi:hypothetical protein